MRSARKKIWQSNLQTFFQNGGRKKGQQCSKTVFLDLRMKRHIHNIIQRLSIQLELERRVRSSSGQRDSAREGSKNLMFLMFADQATGSRSHHFLLTPSPVSEVLSIQRGAHLLILFAVL